MLALNTRLSDQLLIQRKNYNSPGYREDHIPTETQAEENTCLCCHNKLLRQARHAEIYWYCPHCRQEMPNLSLILQQQLGI